MIAQVIRDKMESQGVTVSELAERTGRARSSLSRKLHGHRAFTMNDFEAIASALRVRGSSLLAEAEGDAPASLSPQEVLDHEVACGECGSLDEAAAHLASLAGPGEDAPAGGDAPTAPVGDASPALAGPSVREAA